MLNGSKRVLMGFVLPLSLLTACATTPHSREDEVAQRAQARFDALVARDYKAAYGFFTPSFREKFAYDDYIRARPPRAVFVSSRVVKVDCISEAACDVEMENSYKSPTGVKGAPKGEITRVTSERWVKTEGLWWLFQEK